MRYVAQVALVSIQIHWFKVVNDQHGHDTGDELLKCDAAAMVCYGALKAAVARALPAGTVDAAPVGAALRQAQDRLAAASSSNTLPGDAPAAAEQQIFGALAAQRGIALLAEHPAHSVGDIRFTGAVRADNSRNAGAELKDRASGKGFEALDFEAFEVHSAL